MFNNIKETVGPQCSRWPLFEILCQYVDIHSGLKFHLPNLNKLQFIRKRYCDQVDQYNIPLPERQAKNGVERKVNCADIIQRCEKVRIQKSP